MAETDLVLGVDVGSHGVRCVCGPHTALVHYQGPPPPAPRSAAQWVTAFEGALAQMPPDILARVGGVGITGVRGSFVVCDEAMQPLGPAVPDFDEEAIPTSLELKARFGDTVVARTGCPPFPLSGLPKLVTLAKRRGSTACTVLAPQDYLAWHLTGETRMSAGAALRLGCLERSGEAYASDLLAEAGVPLDILPDLVPVGESMGRVVNGPLPRGAPVIAVTGDGPAAWAAAGRDGHALISLGTTTVTLLPANDDPEIQGDVTLELNPYGGRLLEYGSGVGGVAIDWLSGLTGLSPDELDRRSRVVGPRLPRAVPGFLSAWGSAPGASFSDIFLDSGPGELAAALFDAIARDAVASLVMLATKGRPPTRLYLTGGCARSQRVVDLIRRETTVPIHLAGHSELAARGAAVIAEHFLRKGSK